MASGARSCHELASTFLDRWSSSDSPAPKDAHLRAVVERSEAVLSDLGARADDDGALERCAARLRKFLKTDLRKEETLAGVFYNGERDEWIVRLEEAAYVLGTHLDISRTTPSDEAWSVTERRAREFVSENYDYPRRADPDELRRLLFDTLAILRDIYIAGDLVAAVYPALKDIRSFLKLDDKDLVRSWPSDQKHPDWIVHLREAGYVIRVTLDLRSKPPREKAVVVLAAPSPRNSPSHLQTSCSAFPRHWRRTPLRIHPGALPPLPKISDSRHDQIFGPQKPSTTVTVISDTYRPLDFLGDALLGHLVARILHKSFPHLRNGDLTYLRSLLVRNTTLSYLAWHYNFHTLVRPARALHHLDQKEVADLFEAYLGAVSLESHGERKAAAWVTAIFSPSVFPDAGEVARQINNGKENEDFWDDPVGDLREALDVVEKTSACASGNLPATAPLRNINGCQTLDERLAALSI